MNLTPMSNLRTASILAATLDVRFQETDAQLSVTAAGPYSLEKVKGLFDKAKFEAEKRGKYVVLLDMTPIAGAVSNLEMHELARHLTGIWNRAVRLAIVAPAGGVNKFFESVLWTRGVAVAVV